jgi:spoIIIJ-associated protein
MEWVETTGRTVEAALDAALDELGVDEDDVEYEVLEQPRTGLFGRIGAGDARVRARVKPISREKPGERQSRQRRGGSGSRPRSGGAGSTSTKASGSGRESRSSAAPAAAGPDGDDASVEVEGEAAERPARSRQRGSRGRGRSRSPASGARSGADERTRDESTAAERPGTEGMAVDTDEQSVPVEEQGRVAEEFTRALVDAFDLGARVNLIIEEGAVVIDITGENLGLLVGPRGATLTAIEELVRTVVQRETDGRGARINVDVAGYRAKRRAALEEFTRSLAEKALSTGRPQRLEPMSSSDRKVVHDTAAGIEGVVTESEGEDPRRRVVLRPA